MSLATFENEFATPSVDLVATLDHNHESNSITFADDTTTVGKISSHEKRSWVKTFIGVSGNVLEWYDFAIFGYFADILGDVFFPPHQDGHAAIMESFVVFGGAFFMRPLGGLVIGYIGDKYGSRKALSLSIFLMAFPTFFMGCLPGYALVGPWAIVLLTVVRLLQGLSVGGQLMSSLMFTLERHPKSKWGLYGSYVMAAANFGTLLGGLVASLIRRSLSVEALHTWGWRVPFLSGIFVSFSGFYLRNHEGDDTEINNHRHDIPRSAPRLNPIKIAFRRENLRSLLACIMVPLLWSSGFYLCFIWMAIYMSDLIDPPIINSFNVNSASLFFSVCLLFPVMGWISDRKSRKLVMTIGGILLGVSGPFMIGCIGNGSPTIAFVAQMFLGISLCMWGAPMMAWLAESFEPAARLTSVSVGYNIAQAFGGGIAPALATSLVGRFGNTSPGYYLTVIAVIALIGLLFVAPRVPYHFAVIQEETDIECNTMKAKHTLSGDNTHVSDADNSLDGETEII